MLPKNGRLLRIYIGEDDSHQGLRLYEWIVRKARERHLAGATVLKGLEGFGAKSRIHATNFLSLSSDSPIVIEIVDTAEKIDKFLPEVEESVHAGMVTLERVQIHFYRGDRDSRNES